MSLGFRDGRGAHVHPTKAAQQLVFLHAVVWHAPASSSTVHACVHLSDPPPLALIHSSGNMTFLISSSHIKENRWEPPCLPALRKDNAREKYTLQSVDSKLYTTILLESEARRGEVRLSDVKLRSLPSAARGRSAHLRPTGPVLRKSGYIPICWPAWEGGWRAW